MTELVHAKSAFKRVVAGLPGVNGLAIGFKRVNGHDTPELAIVVFVDRKLPLADVPSRQRIPNRYGRYVTDVQQMSRERCNCSEEPGVGELARPLMGGTILSAFTANPLCKIGGEQFPLSTDSETAFSQGTFGCVVRSRSDGKLCALTNQHVVTTIQKDVRFDLTGNNNPEASAREYVGIDAWQGYPPLTTDDASPKTLGEKHAYDKSRTCCFWLCGAAADPPPAGRVYKVGPADSPDGPIDAALVALAPGLEYQTGIIGGIGIQGLFPFPADPHQLVGTLVQKRGHRTHLTFGQITHSYDETIPLDPFTERNCKSNQPQNLLLIKPVAPFFERGGTKWFVDQGDSGSILLTMNNLVIGLIFANKLVHITRQPDEPPEEAHGYAMPIDRIAAPSGLDIEFPPFGAPVPPTTVPAGNLAGVPHRSPLGGPPLASSGPAAERVAAQQQLWGMRQRIARSAQGREALLIFERTRAEVSRLIDQHRSMYIAWHRNLGPSWGWELQRTLLDPTATFPRELKGRRLDDCMDSILAEMAKLGSDALRSDIAEHAMALRSLAGADREALAARLRGF